MKLILTGACLMLFSALSAQKIIIDTLWVGGVCGMCETRIEKAMDAKGIISADFDLNTNKLALVYNSKKITEDEIHGRLNAVGHDTRKSKASDDVYNAIHECCKYRQNEEKHECDGEHK